MHRYIHSMEQEIITFKWSHATLNRNLSPRVSISLVLIDLQIYLISFYLYDNVSAGKITLLASILEALFSVISVSEMQIIIWRL